MNIHVSDHSDFGQRRMDAKVFTIAPFFLRNALKREEPKNGQRKPIDVTFHIFGSHYFSHICLSIHRKVIENKVSLRFTEIREGKTKSCFIIPQQ